MQVYLLYILLKYLERYVACMLGKIYSEIRVRSLCENHRTNRNYRRNIYSSTHPVIVEFEKLNERFGNCLTNREIEFFERYLAEPETTGVQFCKEYRLTTYKLNACLKNIIDTLRYYLDRTKGSSEFIKGKYIGCYHILNAIEEFTDIYGIKYFVRSKRKHFSEIYYSTSNILKGRKTI